jgi:membrane protease YdiL (CAAX protease family)
LTAIVASWTVNVFIPASGHRNAFQSGMVLLVRDTAAIAVMGFLGARYLRASVADFGLTRPRASHIVLGIAVAVAYALTISPLLNRLLPEPKHDFELYGLGGSSIPGQVFVFAIVGVYSPFVEEVVYRGLLLTGLLQRLNVSVAILLSATIFAISHASAGDVSIVNALLLGLLQGYLYVRLRSLTASIACHMVINSWATIFTIHVLQVHR